MSKVTLYMHIGVPKTATTTVQKSLWDNKPALLKAGWLYPETGSTGYGHHLLSQEIIKGSRSGIFERLADEVQAAQAEKVILSSEDFSSLKPEQIEDLRQRLPQSWDIRILLYLRRQDQFMYAQWAQGVKYMTVIAPFEQWANTRISSPRNITHYDHLLDKWAGVFGKENIILRVFEKGSLKEHIFHDFLRACNVPDPLQYPFSSDINITPGVRTLQIIQTLNELSGLHSRESDREVAHLLGGLILAYYEQKRVEEKADHRIYNDFADEIRDRLDDINRSVARDYLGKETLFDAAPVKLATRYDLSDLSGQEALDLFGFVLPGLIDGIHQKDRENQAHGEVNNTGPGGEGKGTSSRLARFILSTPLRGPITRLYYRIKGMF